MIKVDNIIKILKLVLASGFLKKEKPLSLFIVSKSGNGKTEVISKYKTTTSLFITDLSYMGLLHLLREKPRLKHILIPDFLKITMKKRSTSDNLVSLLNASTEEGIGRIDIYNFKHDFKNKNIGIIIATTKASFSQKSNNWKNIGFLQRMITCSYDYKEETINEIFSYINKELYNLEKKFKNLSIKSMNIKSSKDLNKQLNKYANKKFRNIKQLQTLAKCNALLRKSPQVEQQDIDEIIRLTEYLNLNYKKI